MRLLLLLKLLLLCGFALAPVRLLACEPWAARVTAVKGEVLVETRSASRDRTPATVEMLICPGEKLLTGNNSRAAVYLSNNTFVRLDQNSILILPQQNRIGSYWIRLQQGLAHFISRISSRFELETPFLNAALEGTEFLLSARAGEAALGVIEGTVLASPPASSMTQEVEGGELLTATAGTISTALLPIDKTAAVDWAIYYPPLFTLDRLAQSVQPDSARRGWLESAARRVQQGRPDLALHELAAADPSGPLMRIARATVLLSAGQVEQAEAALHDLQEPTALALRSVIYSVTNKPQQALELARFALQADAQSSEALLALSYAQQVNLDLPAALKAAQTASELHPQQSLVWSRLGELQLMLGQLQSAEVSTTRALALAADDTQALLQQAFLELFSLRFAAAQRLFERVIALDSENPRAHLGLGLTWLRQGDLESGRRQLEIATSLDPARSLLRSYLGRAYFEEKRDALAAVQWQLAREFDPDDPTPWFYSGVNKLFANQPIAAIADLEKSRALNNRRALYRSETLLQSDAASRSATLARAYNEAGYAQGVLLAASDALRSDPGAAEGHRLLADTYRGNPRFEAARVSELQQAQLLQSPSTYPLQPQLSESGLTIIENLGPARPGFNEYHALFNQDDINLHVGGLIAGDGTLADEVVLSGLQGPVSLSVGQYHYETDGFRSSAGQQQDIHNVLLQWQVTPVASVELEYRDLSLERGDLGLAAIAQGIRLNRDLKTWRLGSYLQLAADHGVMLSAITQELEDHTTLEGVPGFEAGLEEDPWILEAKYLGRLGDWKLQVGAGQYRAQLREMDTFSGNSSQRNTHRNAYVYADYSVSRNLYLEAGLAFDDLTQSDADDLSQWSPKFGVTWQAQNWRLRTSLFRAFKRDLAADQTIEKTYLAGFNQIFSDVNSADSKNVALALDVSVTPKIYAGLEMMHRDVEFPALDLTDNTRRDFDYSEAFGSAYLSALIGEQWSAGITYQYDDNQFDYVEEQGLSSAIVRSVTHVVPVTLRYFMGSMVSLDLVAKYVNQENTLALFDLFTFTPFQSQQRQEAWLFDARISFKLPRRLGVLELGASNLSDRNVEIIDETANLLRFYPSRLVYSRIQINF